MLGFMKIHKNNFSNKYFLLYIFIILIVGCKTSKEIEKKEESDQALKNFITKYESTFDPSVYHEDVKLILEEERREKEFMEAAKVFTVAPQESIPGFRVQVLFTPEIDQANHTRDELLNLLPDEWCYIVYDAPYYKVRVGDFIERVEANQMVKKLISLGYKDAWIVPDKIIKNPPPKPPEVFIEPDKQPEPRR